VKSQITAPLLDRAIRYAIERKRNEEQLLQLAQFDALTGIANRAHFNTHLKNTIAQAKRSGVQGALLLLDLDNLKKINDSLGHPEGDRLLQDVASRLSACIRESDFVARLGGDEFAVIGPNVVGAEGAVNLARKIGEIFDAPFSLSDQTIYSGASVGISLFPADSDQPDDLLKNADMALYEAKKKSRGTYRFFDADMNLWAQARRTMAVELRDAVFGDGLELHFQPMVSTSNGAMAGVEALVRWPHPQRGMIPPETFIRAAETSGTIVPLGAWVLRTACQQMTKWRAVGLPPISVSINLSPIELRQANFAQSVRRVLDAAGIDPLLIEFEITENVVMENADSCIKTMRALQEIGISLAIDDFGVGYSSLSYLMNFPLNRLKIDRSFISRVTDDPNTAAIARTIIALAKNLNLGIVAEGVESRAQLEFCRREGCDEVQGFYFSQALSAERLIEWYRQRTPAQTARLLVAVPR
jgi:diguanylate cyclase (GGDEF)-like protein